MGNLFDFSFIYLTFYRQRSTIGGVGAEVEFDVNVEAIDENELALKKQGEGINFVRLVDGGGSHMDITQGQSPQFDINQLDSRGSTDAAHEFGHILGYNISKGIFTSKDKGYYDQDNNHHANRDKPQERFYIMSRAHGIDNAANDVSRRRVADIEISRLNQGQGIRLPNHNSVKVIH